MAFAKMVGLVVTPTTWSCSIRSARLPVTSRSRLRSSSQIETPTLLRSASALVIATLLSAAGCSPASGHAGQGEELRPRTRIGAQRAVQRRGDGRGPAGSHSAQGHAGVLGLEHHTRPARAQATDERVQDLLSQPLLGLRPRRVVLDKAG